MCTVVTKVRLIMGWTGKVHLVDEKGRCRAAWKAVVGKRQGRAQRVFWHARAHRLMRLRVGWAKVTHPSHPDHRLFLVVVGGYTEPWYLLTNEAISSEEDAQAGWRWPLCNEGLSSKCGASRKVSLALRVCADGAGEDRLKLLSMAMLAHAFLLRLMDSSLVRELVRHWLLHHGCPRPGQHCRLTLLPLSRLRAALCWLWQHRLPAWATPRLRPHRRLPASGQAAGGVLLSMQS